MPHGGYSLKEMPTKRNNERRDDHSVLTGNNTPRRLQLKFIRAVVLIALFSSSLTLPSAATPESIGSDNDDRHGDPQFEDELTVEASRAYLRHLFEKYGDPSTALNGDSGIDDRSPLDMTMTFEGFEHLLESLGLGDVHITDHKTDDHRQSMDSTTNSDSGQFRRFHEQDETGWHRHQQRHVNDDERPDRDKRSVDDNNRTSHDDKLTAKTAATLSKVETISNKLVRSRSERNLRAVDEEQSSLAISKGPIVLHKCMSAVEILETYHIHHYTRHIDNVHTDSGVRHSRTPRRRVDIPDYISHADFVAICPSIIYQLDEGICQQSHHGTERPSKICNDGLNCSNPSEKNGTTQTENVNSIFGVPLTTWGFAILSIVIISLVGLVTVAIIPFMGYGERRYFNGILQLLIALAVGTLTGDALLHLLPHALVPHDSHATEIVNHSDHLDDGNSREAKTVAIVTHGLAVLVGIFGFMFVERILSICSRFRRRRALHVASNKDIQIQQVGYKLSSHGDTRSSIVVGNAGTRVGTVERHHSIKADLTDDGDHSRELIQLLERPATMITAEQGHNLAIEEDRRLKSDVDNVDCQLSRQREVEVVAFTNRDGSHEHHGHSHGVVGTSNVASVAWMIILGDGLHNFTDGLAIGASFVGGGLAGGLGTTVAVFCHELPHELGDFAVLLNAGMSVRQALFYNFVSSVLSFVGMLIGVLVGNIGSASSWIFGLTAGIFIYISLVDMMPQMISPESKDDDEDQRPLSTDVIYLLLHVLGIAGGLTIMTFIALFEDRIQWIAGGFGPSD